MVFLQIQELILQDNMQGSKCDEYCKFLWELVSFSFYEKVPSSFDPVVFFFSKYFYLNSPWCFQLILDINVQLY